MCFCLNYPVRFDSLTSISQGYFYNFHIFWKFIGLDIYLLVFQTLLSCLGFSYSKYEGCCIFLFKILNFVKLEVQLHKALGDC